ncbi:MAG: hypothetical protein Kow0090_21250 [Myxococcota bacterium]
MKGKRFIVSAILLLITLFVWGVFCACSPMGKDKSSEKSIQIFGKKETAKSPIIATVGESVITKKDFEERLSRLNPYLRSRYKSLDQKKKLLEIMIKNEALAQEAMKLDLQNDPRIIEQIKSELANTIIKSEFDGKMKDSLVTDEDIKKYYEENIEQYKRPATARVSHIFFEKGARAQAEKVYKMLKAQADERRNFTKLAKEFSMDEETKNIGGDLAYMTEEEMTAKFGKAFADAAFALQNTEDMSPIVETEKGFHILKLRGKRQPIDRPLDKVKSSIQSRLYYSKRSEALDKWVEDIKNKLGVKINDKALEEIEVSDTSEKAEEGEAGGHFHPPRPLGAQKALKGLEKGEIEKALPEKKIVPEKRETPKEVK